NLDVRDGVHGARVGTGDLVQGHIRDGAEVQGCGATVGLDDTATGVAGDVLHHRTQGGVLQGTTNEGFNGCGILRAGVPATLDRREALVSDNRFNRDILL